MPLRGLDAFVTQELLQVFHAAPGVQILDGEGFEMSSRRFPAGRRHMDGSDLHHLQWVRHGAKLSDDGRTITLDMVRACISEQKKRLPGARAAKAAEIFERMIASPDFPEFLTLVAYESID